MDECKPLIMGGSQTAASAAWTRQVLTQAASIAADALRGFPVSKLGDETIPIPSMKVLPGAMRVAGAYTRPLFSST